MDDVIVGFGEVLWDILPEGRKVGGAPANFAYHVSQFGMNSRVVSAVGEDDLGEEILEDFKQKHLAFHVDKVPYPTGTVSVKLDGQGIPCYDIRENVAWDNIPFTSSLEELAARTSCVCFGSLAQRSVISRTSVHLFLDRMPAGSHKVFDINIRQDFYTKEGLCDSMRRCDILKLNDEELELLGRMLDYPEGSQEERCRRLSRDFDLRILILTCGARGSYVFTSKDTSFLETPKVEVADTVGAGDSFTAAFCCAMLKRKPLREAHRLAVDVSAFVCSCRGAMPVLPEELKSRLM